CPLQRPRPSPPADAGIRLLCPVPVRRDLRAPPPSAAGNLKFYKNVIFFFFFILHSKTLLSQPISHTFCP
ncbi:unnamed protein product, partial [Staurois parvus]